MEPGHAARKLITLLPDRDSFTVDWLRDALAARGVTDRRRVDAAIETLALYAVLHRDGERVEFVLKNFPVAARRLDIDAEISAQQLALEGA